MARWMLVLGAMAGACGAVSDSVEPRVQLAIEAVTLRQAVVFPAIDGNGLTVVHGDPMIRRESLSMAFEGRVHDAQIVGDTIVASLRDEGAVVLVQIIDGALAEVGRIPVGPTPLGIAVDPDWGRVWVAVSLSDDLVEVDLVEQAVIRRVSVGQQPRWVRYLETGEIFVGSTHGDTFHLVDADTGLPRAIGLPSRSRASIPQQVRVTGAGDIMNLDGVSHLLVPALYVDNLMQVSIGVPDPDTDVDLPPAYYVSMPEGIVDLGRVVPVLVDLDLSLQQDTRVLAPSGTALDEVGRRMPLRSEFSDVHVLTDEERVLVTMPGADAVLVVDVQTSGINRSGPFELFYASTLHSRGGPVAFRSQGRNLWVHNFVQEAAAPLMRGLIDDAIVTTDPRLASTHGTFKTSRSAEATTGRALFYSAVDPRVTTPLGGISCSTCHFDGGNDGLTWHVEPGPRQTPSLGGEVSSTAPMTWTSGVESLTHEVFITAAGRMAAPEMTEALAGDLAAFVDSVPLVDVGTAAEANLDPAMIDRGKQIFEGSAACADCHVGPALTNNGSYAMFELRAVTTPALRSLRASPPYLHDGRALSLEQVVDLAEDGGMGRTNHLSASEKADLVAYLKSL